jgi:hypothetical protein
MLIIVLTNTALNKVVKSLTTNLRGVNSVFREEMENSYP